MDKRAFVKNWSARQSRIPAEGLVFYAPLDKYAEKAETGQLLTYPETVTYGMFSVVGGIPCMNGYVADVNSEFVRATIDIDSTAQQELTISVWEYPIAYQNNGEIVSVNIDIGGTSLFATNLKHSWNGYHYATTVAKGNMTDSKVYAKEKWHHVVLTYKAPTDGPRVGALYMNGSKVAEAEATGASTRRCIYKNIVLGSGGSGLTLNACLSTCRIYDRVLIDEEIRNLANEFHPTAGGGQTV